MSKIKLPIFNPDDTEIIRYIEKNNNVSGKILGAGIIELIRMRYVKNVKTGSIRVNSNRNAAIDKTL